MSTNEQLLAIWREAWQPPDRQPPWRWAEEHISSIPYSPLPGRFRSDNSPMIREVMESIVSTRTRLVSIVAAVQSSKSTVAELTLCYIIANAPGPTLWLDQTDDDARDQSESRLQPLFNNCGPVKALFPANPNRKKNMSIHFANGMVLWMAGAHNKGNLQRRSIRWLVGDETWRWPSGHMAEAQARVTAYGWLSKCIFLSQGGFAGDDTHRTFEMTDQREWEFPCPKCGQFQPYSWEQVEWDHDCKLQDGSYDFQRVRESTHLRCAYCGHRMFDSDETRRRLNAGGKFVPLNPHAARENVGYHWNALATMGWGALAEMYLRAKMAARAGDASLLQQFRQKRLALPWEANLEEYKVEQTQADYLLGELWDEEGEVENTRLRIMTVDVQKDCFYLVIRSWSNTGSSRLLHCERVNTWEALQQVAEAHGVPEALVFVDCGYSTYDVYAQCAANSWTALKGDSHTTYTHRTRSGQTVQRYYSPRRRIHLGRNRYASMHYWSNLTVKDALARLRKSTEGATWEIPMDAPDDYLDQLDSEFRVLERGHWVWKRKGHRDNHYFDCEAMQVCVAFMLKIVGAESPAASADRKPSSAADLTLPP